VVIPGLLFDDLLLQIFDLDEVAVRISGIDDEIFENSNEETVDVIAGERKGRRQKQDNSQVEIMGDLTIKEYTTYEEFTEAWEGSDTDTRMLWQLLGQLEADELLIQLPKWLAEEKTSYVDGATPTAFVARIERETEKAILLSDSADARSLMKLAHRIHQLEHQEHDKDRTEWLNDRLAAHRRTFEQRDDVLTLRESWIPKSQLQHVVRPP